MKAIYLVRGNPVVPCGTWGEVEACKTADGDFDEKMYIFRSPKIKTEDNWVFVFESEVKIKHQSSPEEPERKFGREKDFD